MHRFYLPPDQCNATGLVLDGREAHHALHVLRVRPGDPLTVLDGAGREFVCTVASHTREEVSLTIVTRQSRPAPPAQITLLQALPKGKIIESIIQKSTELGVARIVPLLSERVVARPDPREAAQRGEKLQTIAIEAIKQCGAPWLPRVEAPAPLAQFISRQEPFELSLVGSLQENSAHPRESFYSFYSKRGRLPKSIAVWIGPEGDFTPGEIADIRGSGAVPITLGPLVLRSETAAIYCLSVIRYELQASASSAFVAKTS